MGDEYKWWEHANPCPKCGDKEELQQMEGDSIAWTLWIECFACGYFGKTATGRGSMYEETSKKSVELWNISELEKELL